MTLSHIENPKDSSKDTGKKTQKLINQFSKTAGYRINIQKSHYNSIKKNRILKNKYNQGSEDPYTENYETVMKQTKESINK